MTSHYLPAIKVCGITNAADALLAAKLGAHYLGYILNYSASPRRLTAVNCIGIITAVRALYPQVQHVGVTVDLQADTTNDLVRRLRLDVVQLHGHESTETIQAIRAPQVWKSIILKTENDLAQLNDYVAVVDAIHIDAGRGSGQTIAPKLMQAASHFLQTAAGRSTPLIIAGGITPDTISDFLTYHSAVLDVNSGVEAVPGKKDPQLLVRVFESVYAWA